MQYYSPINQLSPLDTLTGGDLLAVLATSQGGARSASLTLLLSYMQSNLTFESTLYMPEYVTQYSAPSASAFSVQVTNGEDNIHLILTPTAGFEEGTIVLPISPGVVDKQEVLVNCTQAVTTLTINKNGATALTGSPTTLGANAFFRLKYDLPTSTWYRVG